MCGTNENLSAAHLIKIARTLNINLLVLDDNNAHIAHNNVDNDLYHTIISSTLVQPNINHFFHGSAQLIEHTECYSVCEHIIPFDNRIGLAIKLGIQRTDMPNGPIERNKNILIEQLISIDAEKID